jgi:hypothetical protein
VLSFRKHNFRIRPIGADTNSGQQASNKAYKWLAVVASMVMLTSFTIASAAPTSNPPTGNVAPNFSGVDVSTKSSQTDPSFAKLRVSTDNTDGVVLEDYTDTNRFSRMSTVDPVSGEPTVNLLQRFVYNTNLIGSNQLLFSATLGARFTSHAFSVITTAGDINLNAGTNSINLQAAEVNIGSNGSMGYFKTNAVQLSTQTFQRNRDGNAIANRFVPCPADANGAYTGFVMACAYKVTGNQNLISNNSSKSFDTNGNMGCNYNLVFNQINNPSPLTTSNVYARQLCYYGL